MTEEVTSALANVKGLKVVARTSAFAFKGKNEDVRAIGRELSATDIIEGSVRKEGDKVRITAQLVRADTGDHLWTESYDRDLKDVFAVQEDIARAISAALRVPLGLNAGEKLVPSRIADTAAYEDYLHALTLYRAREINQVVATLEQVVKREPNYAPAWALLAQSYAFEPVYVIGMNADRKAWGDEVSSAFTKAEQAAREAIRLDPHYAPGYTAQGWLDTYRGQWAAADTAFDKALALDANDPDTLHLYALSLAAEGRIKDALAKRRALSQLEPLVPIYNVYMAVITQLAGDTTGAIRILQQISPAGPVGAQRSSNLALAYASMGEFQQASDALRSIGPDQAIFLANPAEAGIILGKAPGKIAAPQPTAVSITETGWVYFFVGAPQRVLDTNEAHLAANMYWTASAMQLWHPVFAPLRKTDQYKSLMRKLGLVDYWRATSWPDLCRPVGLEDFRCN